jgi:hypothetical protein
MFPRGQDNTSESNGGSVRVSTPKINSLGHRKSAGVLVSGVETGIRQKGSNSQWNDCEEAGG